LLLFDTEKVDGVHQLPTSAGYEEWQVRAGLQAVPEDDPPGQSQAGHPGQQLPRSQVKISHLASTGWDIFVFKPIACNVLSAGWTTMDGINIDCKIVGPLLTIAAMLSANIPILQGLKAA